MEKELCHPFSGHSFERSDPMRRMEMEYGVLGEDILVEILKRLPKKYQFRLRCVSKGWLHLLSDRSSRMSSITTDTGLLLQRMSRSFPCSLSGDMTFLRLLNEDGSAAFVDHSLGFSTDVDVSILGICNGLLLLGRFLLRPVNYILEYIVYNPSTKLPVRIPIPSGKPGPDMMSPPGFAFDGRHYYVIHFCRTRYKKDETLDFHIFSSQTGEWDENHLTRPSLSRVDDGLYVDDELYDDDYRGETLVLEEANDNRDNGNKSLFLKGAIHWVLNNSLLIYHLKDVYFKLIQLPRSNVIYFYKCIWNSNGCLYYCQGNKDGIRIWVLHMEGMDYPRDLDHYVEWRLKHDAVLTTLLPELRCAFRPYAFNDDFETVYLENNRRLFSYKPETRVLKEVWISNFGVGTRVYPFVYNTVYDFPQQVQFPKQPRVKKECR